MAALLVIADIEDLRWKHGSGHADVLLSCGDVPDQVILEAADAWGCGLIFAVKGNHDAIFPFPSPIVDLHLKIVEHDGIRFGGWNGAWKYKPRGHFLYDQAEVAASLCSFPPTDVFLSHNSPRGIHDRDDGVHVGFDGLGSYVARAKPALLFHGHQHVAAESVLGRTRIVGIHGYRKLSIEPVRFPIVPSRTSAT